MLPSIARCSGDGLDPYNHEQPDEMHEQPFTALASQAAKVEDCRHSSRKDVGHDFFQIPHKPRCITNTVISEGRSQKMSNKQRQGGRPLLRFLLRCRSSITTLSRKLKSLSSCFSLLTESLLQVPATTLPRSNDPPPSPETHPTGSANTPVPAQSLPENLDVFAGPAPAALLDKGKRAEAVPPAWKPRHHVSPVELCVVFDIVPTMCGFCPKPFDPWSPDRPDHRCSRPERGRGSPSAPGHRQPPAAHPGSVPAVG